MVRRELVLDIEYDGRELPEHEVKGFIEYGTRGVENIETVDIVRIGDSVPSQPVVWLLETCSDTVNDGYTKLLGIFPTKEIAERVEAGINERRKVAVANAVEYYRRAIGTRKHAEKLAEERVPSVQVYSLPLGEGDTDEILALFASWENR